MRRGADLIGAHLPTDPGKKAAVETGHGSVLGMLVGLSVGVTLGALRRSGRLRGPATTVGSAWVLVMLAGDAPMTVLGVTDPRTWSAVGWATDILPGAAYTLAAAATLQAFDG